MSLPASGPALSALDTVAWCSQFDSSYSDWCYSPIVQSGGDYDLRTSAASDDQRLRDRGIILASLGIRYKSYCANVGRTFMVDPDKVRGPTQLRAQV